MSRILITYGNYITSTASMRSGSGSSMNETLDHEESSQDDSDEEVDFASCIQKSFLKSAHN